MSPERRGDSVRKKTQGREMSGEGTAMELAGAQINANDGEQWGGERNSEGGCAFRQRLSHNGECLASLFGD